MFGAGFHVKEWEWNGRLREDLLLKYILIHWRTLWCQVWNSFIQITNLISSNITALFTQPTLWLSGCNRQILKPSSNSSDINPTKNVWGWLASSCIVAALYFRTARSYRKDFRSYGRNWIKKEEIYTVQNNK